MIDLPLLVAWLDSVDTVLDLKFVKGPRAPEFLRGDRVAVVTPLEGPGLTLEGAGSVASFQLRIVAREHDEDALRKSAFQVDEALLFGSYPADLWGTRIQYVDRTGGEPSSLVEDEHDRVAYVCSYIAHEMPER